MSENLTTNPLKLSQPAGAALAFMGIKGSVPLWHGVQGCAAFGKILFIQHFREPMPFQTTALNHVGVVMGGDENGVEALGTLEKEACIIGLFTTGVTETSGADITGLAKSYKEKSPGARVVAVSTPDYEGSLETGYGKAVRATLETIAGPRTRPRRRQVALLSGPYVTPGEVEELRNVFAGFGLRPVIFPDLGDSLYGYLTDFDFSPCSIGGTTVEEIETLADSAFVVSIGRSMRKTAHWFAEKNGLEAHHFDHLSTLDEIDGFFKLLEDKSGNPVPMRYRKQRRHLQDTLLDTHFYLGSNNKAAAVAGDPDFILRWMAPLEEMGLRVEALSTVPIRDLSAGDLEDFAGMVKKGEIGLVIGNSHVAKLAEGLSIPALRAGMPVYDRLGEPQSVRLGYNGLAGLYRECANELIKSSKPEEGYLSPLQAGLR